jgi:hypothetical protein
VGDELIDLECSVEILFDKFWHAFNAFVAAKRSSFPDSSGDFN